MKTTTGRKATTTIEISAEPLAKLRAHLRALGTRITAEDVVSEWLDSIASDEPASGYLGETAHDDWATHPKRKEMEEKMARISAGDRRLVRREPLPRNIFAHQWTVEKLKKLAADPKVNLCGAYWEHLATSLLDHAASTFTGTIGYTEPKEEVGTFAKKGGAVA